MIELPTGWVQASLEEIADVLDYEREPVNASERESRIAGKLQADLYPYFGATGQVGLIDSFRSDGERVLLGEDAAPFLDPTKEKAYLATGRFWVNNHAHVLRGAGDLVNNRFLCHQLNVVDYHQFVTGSTRLKLTSAAMRRIPVLLAPAREQTRIVAKLEELLSDLDAGVAELKVAQKKLQRYRQSLLKSAVEGALTAEWREDRRQKGAPTETGARLLARTLSERRVRWEARQIAKFKEQGRVPPKGWQLRYPEPVRPETSELPPLPEGWVWASLDMLGEIASGVAKGTKTGSDAVREVPYLRVANVQRGFLDLSEVKTIPATARDIEELRLLNGDVLFNEGGDRDKLGRGWVWREQVADCIHQNHVFRVRLYSPELQPEFISHHGNTFGKLWFQRAGKQTTNLASINMTMLREFPVPVAPPEEQSAIIEQIRLQLVNVDHQEAAVDKAIRQSAVQRQNILCAAYAGKLAVQDPTEESAHKLLQRIADGRAAKEGLRNRRSKEVA